MSREPHGEALEFAWLNHADIPALFPGLERPADKLEAMIGVQPRVTTIREGATPGIGSPSRMGGRSS
jgi:hypothetical protein